MTQTSAITGHDPQEGPRDARFGAFLDRAIAINLSISWTKRERGRQM